MTVGIYSTQQLSRLFRYAVLLILPLFRHLKDYSQLPDLLP